MNFEHVTPNQWEFFFIALSLLWGACIGSFLNACIYRIPRDLSLTNPKFSFCPHCNHQIAWYHNIPLFSFLALQGKCKYCGGKISPRYFLVELLTAILFVLVWFKFDIEPGWRPLGLTPVTDIALVPVYWLILSGLILGTFVDFEHYIIPDRVTIGGIIAGLIISLLVPSLHDQTHFIPSFIQSVIGLIVGFGLLWLTSVLGKMAFKKDAMGFGDVKLLGAMGAFLGWKAVLFIILSSTFTGSIVGLTLIACKRKDMGSRIPFGPYLALGAVLWIFWGESWIQAYIDHCSQIAANL